MERETKAYEKVKTIITHPDNKEMHITAIDRLVKIFSDNFSDQIPEKVDEIYETWTVERIKISNE